MCEEEEYSTTTNDNNSNDTNSNDDGVSPKETVVDTPPFYYVLQAQPSNIASCQPISLYRPHYIANFAYRPEGGSCGCVGSGDGGDTN